MNFTAAHRFLLNFKVRKLLKIRKLQIPGLRSHSRFVCFVGITAHQQKLSHIVSRPEQRFHLRLGCGARVVAGVGWPGMGATVICGLGVRSGFGVGTLQSHTGW